MNKKIHLSLDLAEGAAALSRKASVNALDSVSLSPSPSPSLSIYICIYVYIFNIHIYTYIYKNVHLIIYTLRTARRICRGKNR